MAKYIPLDAVVAMINKRKEAINPTNSHTMYVPNMDKFYRGWMNALSWAEKEIINSTEVKEVDLEKEIQDHIRECLDVKFPTTDIELIKKDVAYTAKKFFELGLKAQKGE